MGKKRADTHGISSLRRSNSWLRAYSCSGDKLALNLAPIFTVWIEDEEWVLFLSVQIILIGKSQMRTPLLFTMSTIHVPVNIWSAVHPKEIPPILRLRTWQTQSWLIIKVFSSLCLRYFLTSWSFKFRLFKWLKNNIKNKHGCWFWVRGKIYQLVMIILATNTRRYVYGDDILAWGIERALISILNTPLCTITVRLTFQIANCISDFFTVFISPLNTLDIYADIVILYQSLADPCRFPPCVRL